MHEMIDKCIIHWVCYTGIIVALNDNKLNTPSTPFNFDNTGVSSNTYIKPVNVHIACFFGSVDNRIC